MFILFVVPILCFIMAFASKISKLISPEFLRETSLTRSLRAEAEMYQRELSRISMRDEYIEYVKLERKLVAVNNQLSEAKGQHTMQRMVAELGIQYGICVLFTLALVVISVMYRYTPVVVFGDNFNFDPFGKVLSFPTGVPNAISMVFWIVVNNFVARTVAGYVK